MAAEGLHRQRRRRETLLDASIPRRLPADLFESEVLDPLENQDFRERPIDPEMVRRLAALYMTDDEIAKVIDVPIADFKAQYGRITEQGREESLIALRRVRWRVAMRGNVPMLLHLSEQLLNEKASQLPASGDTYNFNFGSEDPRMKLLDAVREAAERMSGREVQPALPPAQIAAKDGEF